MTSSTASAPNTQQQSPQHDPVLRPRAAAEYLGIGRASIYELTKKGLLAAPIAVTERRVGWRVSVLNAYLARRANAPRPVVAVKRAKS